MRTKIGDAGVIPFAFMNATASLGSGALALSALTSIIGFWALSLAPTPIFAAFGQLTAVMIAFSLIVSLLVLPSILLLLTPGRKGGMRERLTEELTRGEWEYEPHARDTAFRRPGEA